MQLQPGERLTAEAGSMASMDGAMQMITAFSGGFFPALLKTFLGGESLFVNTFYNQSDRPLDLVLTQSTVGDIIRLELKAGESICLQP